MDFLATASEVSGFLTTQGFRSALIGGVALAVYGLGRSTLDLDLVTERAAQDALVAHLEALGFATLHRSSGYSNHLHPDASRGRLDFVYVDADTAVRLFAACRPVAGSDGLLVASPEHLVAMKALAIKNDPQRRLQDLTDIRYLHGLPGVDREQIREYLGRHGLLDAYRDLAGET